MQQQLYIAASIVLGGLILLGISWMSSPRSAVRGNRLSALSMVAAVLLVLWHNDIISLPLIWAAVAAGSLGGYLLAVRVTMLQMPQMVALLNGLGGGASALVAMIEIVERFAALEHFSRVAGQLALIIGGITLSGSIIAALKLDRRIVQQPVLLKGHRLLANGTIILMAALSAAALSRPIPPLGALFSTGVLFFALLYGVLLALRVGGADMPITISLLNSFSGLAGAICGLTIGEPLLVAVGAIVGASGFILTRIMCRAMNRSLTGIFSGSSGTYAAPPGEGKPAERKERESAAAPSFRQILAAAKKIIIVPGYGMALSQAQATVKTLMMELEAAGKEVKFAIHPVAGRMPGHMNVLLAEVDVPYDKLHEMQEINPEFKETDVAIVIGANDVVNPAANTAEGTPIYGMPILDVEDAKQVIICNFDKLPGYAGVDNPLYDEGRSDHIALLLGDAKETLDALTRAFRGC